MQPSELLQQIIDKTLGILSFEVFISPVLIMLVYYIGAVVLPVIVYRFVHHTYEKIPSIELPKVDIDAGRIYDKIPVPISPKWIFLLGFAAVEICWRIFFEFFIAYFQMRDALLGMNIGA